MSSLPRKKLPCKKQKKAYYKGSLGISLKKHGYFLARKFLELAPPRSLGFFSETPRSLKRTQREIIHKQNYKPWKKLLTKA